MAAPQAAEARFDLAQSDLDQHYKI